MEQTTINSPASFLRARLMGRIAQNQSYSVRAFARDLKISHSYLSQILNERRKLSLRQALRLSEGLRLEAEERQTFIQLLLETRPERFASGSSASYKDDPISMDMDRFKIIGEWYHGAIVEMTSLKRFRADPRWIARQLGVTSLQVKAAVKRLQRMGVLEMKEKKWVKSHNRFHFPTTSSEVAVRRFHQEMIYKGLKTLDSAQEEDFKHRDITGITIAINPEKIPEAQKRIQRFRNQLADFLSKGETTAVYQLNVQLFSLTRNGVDQPKKKSHAKR
jgi:uncharacterized protein (TIGR02147 family)